MTTNSLVAPQKYLASLTNKNQKILEKCLLKLVSNSTVGLLLIAMTDSD